MSSKKYTAILVSEDTETTRRFSITRKQFRAVVALVSLILVAGSGFAIYMIPRAFDYERLRSEHQSLMEERIKVASLIRDLNRIKQIDSRIRRTLGLDLEFSFESGTGDTLSRLSPPEYSKDVPISYLDNIPSLAPVKGFLTQDFYESPFGRTDDHLAIDIAAKSGSAIHATASGMVVFSGWTYQYGNLVIIYHGDGYFSLYGHNMRNLVKERQFMERGDLIALVGESGITTGPHLHFEIWRDGQPVDPKEYIVEYRTQQLSGSSDGEG